jgi:Domain of unknown function (DUF1989)
MTEQFKILGEQTIEPAGHSAMRIVDLEDREPPILPKNCLMNTINLNKQVSHVSATCSILMKRATMTIIADTCGVHDMLTAACSSFTNEKRDGVKNNRKLPRQSGRSAEVVGHCLERCPFERQRLHELPQQQRPGARPATTSTFPPKWT